MMQSATHLSATYLIDARLLEAYNQLAGIVTELVLLSLAVGIAIGVCITLVTKIWVKNK